MLSQVVRLIGGLILVAGVVAAAILGSRMLTTRTDSSPNAELIRTAREAVELAHDAQQDNRSATLWAGRFRLAGLVIGVTVPLLIAAWIWRSSGQCDLHPAEILECVEQHVLPVIKDPPDPALPGGAQPESHPALVQNARPPEALPR